MMAATGLSSAGSSSGGQDDASQSKLAEFGDNLKQKIMNMDWIQNILNLSRKTDSPEMLTIPLEERVNSLQSQNTEMRSVIEGLLGVLGSHGISLPHSSSPPTEQQQQLPQTASSSEVVGLGLTHHRNGST